MLKLKSNIGIETCFCTHVGAYLIFWMCGLTQNLNGFKILLEKALEKKKKKRKRQGPAQHPCPSARPSSRPSRAGQPRPSVAPTPLPISLAHLARTAAPFSLSSLAATRDPRVSALFFFPGSQTSRTRIGRRPDPGFLGISSFRV